MIGNGNINEFILWVVFFFFFAQKELCCVRSPPNVQYKIWVSSRLDTPFSFNVLTQFNNVYVLMLFCQPLQFL